MRHLGILAASMLLVTAPAAADHQSALTPEALASEAEGAAALAAYEAQFDRADADLGMVFDDNVTITMSDGVELSADIFRPEVEGEYPVILTMTPYHKDMPWVVPPDHEAEQGEFQNWESPNPDRWVPKGYVLVRVDVRGTGTSGGIADLYSAREWQDFYEAVEWSGAQSWSSGNVGLSGISYMALNQWHVAALQPPSLKAMIPWEGLADMYRDSTYVGGIYSAGFLYQYIPEFFRDAVLRGWETRATAETFRVNGFWDSMYNNLLDGDYWNPRIPDWSKVTVPMLSAGNWNGWKGAGHLRGNLEGYRQAASDFRRLRVHTGDHQDAFYSEEGFLEQLRFYDYWLKGVENGVDQDAPVKLAIRHGPGRFDFDWRDEQEWPLARTEYQRMYLVGSEGQIGGLSPIELPEASTLSYHSPGLLLAGNVKEPGSAIQLVSPPFEKDTEITGEILLNLWLSSTIDDAFPHVTLFRVMGEERVVLTTGRLRASQRELDVERSTPSRPYHLHERRIPLTPGEPEELQIEIWPTSMVFPAGSRLVINIAGDSPATQMANAISHRKAMHGLETIHMGGEYDSYIQLPIIPGDEE